jgi:predicted DNA binding CopG/RHH family protein
MFEWDRNNLRKTEAHQAKREGAEQAEGEAMNRKTLEMPKFASESAEADWWASRAGREYVKQKSAEAQSKGNKTKGSSLVAKMNRKSSVQIAIRLPQADLAQARKLAERKGLGYQTLLKMLVHEGLAREARRG